MSGLGSMTSEWAPGGGTSRGAASVGAARRDTHARSVGAYAPEVDATEVLEGLSMPSKRLPCRLFYDAEGSRLFEHICETPEYYPTRTELGILSAHAQEMAHGIGSGATLVEWGSGASVKTRILLRALRDARLYVPIDISEEILMQSARDVELEHAGLEVRPVVADYLQPLRLPLSEAERTRPIVTFFPGSTLGNFEPDAAVTFLTTVRKAGAKWQSFILGTDLPKDRRILEAAYDDAAGITAAFNLNILRVLNRRFGANFDLTAFAHRAVYNAPAGRVEMHLVSRKRQAVTVLGNRVDLERGEPIVTEHCYKYSLPELERMAAHAGFDVVNVWTDPERKFAVQLWRPA